MVLEPTADERILTAAETLAWLEGHLASLDPPPADLVAIGDGRAQALRLLETACSLELAPGVTIQWFAVRIEPPGRERR